jgi:hypothetical protein
MQCYRLFRNDCTILLLTRKNQGVHYFSYSCSLVLSTREDDEDKETIRLHEWSKRLTFSIIHRPSQFSSCLSWYASEQYTVVGFVLLTTAQLRNLKSADLQNN